MKLNSDEMVLRSAKLRLFSWQYSAYGGTTATIGQKLNTVNKVLFSQDDLALLLGMEFRRFLLQSAPLRTPHGGWFFTNRQRFRKQVL